MGAMAEGLRGLGTDSEKGVARSPLSEELGTRCDGLYLRTRALILSVQGFGVHWGRRRHLPGAWHEGEDTPRRSLGHLPRRAVARAHTLAELGVHLPNGIIQPLHQELKNDGETIGLPLSNILEGDLASLEVVNHLDRGHKASPAVQVVRYRPLRVLQVSSRWA